MTQVEASGGAMVEYKIFPAIGVARVGNARESFYIGPETYRGLPINPDGNPFTERDFRDENGALRRQAARFRVYRINNGVAEEVTLQTAGVQSIEWNVHLANKKPSWYEFQAGEGEHGYASNHPLRNSKVTNRHELLIDAGPRQISGARRAGVRFDKESVPQGYNGAHFPPGPLYPMNDSISTLGELRTDNSGRLLVLGGHGISGSTNKEPIQNYANNDGWWDDTSDGPVSATVVLSTGERIVAEPAHVVVAPPKYAPQLANLVTLYDTIFDAMVRSGYYPEIYAGGFWKSGPNGYRPNFRTEIQPLLERASLYPWVTAIPPKPHTFDFEKLGAVGADGLGSPEYRGLRQYLLDFVRPPYQENTLIAKNGATLMPYLAGDNCLNTGTATSTYSRLTDTQYFFLQQWVEGHFVNEPPKKNEPEQLTRAVLDNCVGGPFSPGIEMTWISRDPQIYSAPFRIRPHYVPQGPLGLDFAPERGMEPGDLTRYMAVPWQADFNECSSQPIGERTLWWWPAQRPEFVYLEQRNSESALGALVKEPRVTTNEEETSRTRELESKQQASALPPPPNVDVGVQVPWIGTDFDQKAPDFISFADDIHMVQYWDGLGFVLEKNIDGRDRFVEVARTLPRPFTPTDPEQ